MTLGNKLFRTILEKKAQYLSAWVLVVISSTLFYSCTVAGANLIDNLNQFFTSHHVEDASFIVQKPIQNLTEIEKKYGVTIEPRHSVDLRLGQNTTIRLINATKTIDHYEVTKGTPLQNNHDILLDPGFAKSHHYKIGDYLTLGGETFTITGTMAVPDYIYPLQSVSGYFKNPKVFGIGVVKEAVLNNLPNEHPYYSIRLNGTDKAALKKELNNDNHVVQWIDRKDNNRISFIKGDISGIKEMGETFPIGILLITIVIILILLWRMIKKEYVQVGTLYALGFTKFEILRHYLSYSIVLALAGSIVGTILGWFCLPVLLSVYASFYNLPVLTINPHLSYLLVSLFLPLIFFVPLTYLLIHRVLNKPPVLLMKGGEIKTKVNRLEKSLVSKRMPFSIKFIIREILRNIPRVTFLTVGVVFATLLLLIGFVMKDSFGYLINQDFKNVYHYQNEYIYNQLQTIPPKHGQVASTAPFTITNKQDQSVTITGLQSTNTAIQLKDLKGHRLTFDSVIINKSLADKIGIKAGDTIYVKNQLNNQSFSLKIEYIANSYLGDMIYMPLDRFNQKNHYPIGSYMEVYANQNLNVDPSQLASTLHTKETIDGYEQILKPLKYGVCGIAIVAAIIAIIIIYILISLLIEENTFKISLLKVIGYEDRRIQRMMVDYNFIFVIIGFLIGIPFTTYSMSVMMTSIMADMNLSIPVKINAINIGIGLFILLVSYFVSILLNRRKLNQISMKDAINRSTE
ncbi:ABC transporter permease [Pullulanibacillus sp. KACC 23026]|uniref:FtsX-like permease family protein n=1 Tax=Pullulanibacillus sp. KACC 23026 TaxID=3028315 RepID=UPI0023AEF9AA|nr:ABC transporter permease [Pullulanibacillus sp. KACC 23026]WEG13346.1 ABC transporter permease [Pullulanibacillus sp. KACC 23026]